MEQLNYQGYAQGGGFAPVQVSSNSVARIAREGERVLRGMAAQADQDLQNQRAILNQLGRNQELEQQGRNRNRQAQLQTIQNRKEDSRRDTEIEISNMKAAADSKQEVFKSLSSLSSKAFEIAGEYEKQKFKQQSDEQYWKDFLNGFDGDTLLQDRAYQHQMRFKGEQIEIAADQAQAAGADPVQVDYFRGLNRAQRDGRTRAMIARAGNDFPAWLEQQWMTNETEVTINTANGAETLKPVDAVGSERKAAFIPVLFKQYMEAKGLSGFKSVMLEPFYTKAREAMDKTISRERKIELKESSDNRISVAKDMLYDNFSGDNAINYYNVLRRNGTDEYGNPLTHEQARKELFKTLYTSTDESGKLKYTQGQIEEFLRGAFPDQPTKTIGDRFSSEVAESMRERSKLQNTLFGEQESTKAREWGEYNNNLRDYLNSGKWDGTAESLQPLLEKAQRDGNSEAEKMLQKYATDLSNDGRNDKMYEEIWAEKAAMGLLRVEEVRTANVSAALKLNWIGRAEKSEQDAMPEALKQSVEQQLVSKLSTRLQQFNTTNIKDQSYHRALYAANKQFMSDYMLFMTKPGATPEAAERYAMGIFENEFQNNEGRYALATIDPKTNNRKLFFKNFTVNPASQITFPLTQARDKLKQNPDALATEPMLDPGELKRISAAAKAGKSFSIPRSAQYLANQLNGASISDVLNAQMKYYGIDQIPLKSYERAVTSVDPEYQRLLTYQPNKTRLEIAAYGSGLSGGVAAKRVRGRVNTPGEIMSTYLAAGGNPKEAVLMTAIAMAESAGRQDAYRSDTDVYGWWQIRMAGAIGTERKRQFGLRSNAELFDPVTNAKAALAIRKAQGLGAWEAYTNGRYAEYLPQAQAALKSFGGSPWRQGTSMNFNVVEYLTGDPTHRKFRADHGGSNYHEHVGFRSKADRDRAVDLLRKHGVKIGSMNDGTHAENSLHYADMAVDLPMPHHIKPGSREERAYSRRVRQILGIA